MYISELSLNRFRGANTLTMKLHNRLNVFVGMNGSGKSTLLDASAILLSWLANRIKREGASGRPITETDIRNGESNAMLETTCNYKDNFFSWSLAKNRKGTAKAGGATNLHPLTLVTHQIQNEISKNDTNVNIPLFVYYPVNRAVLDIPLRIREKHQFNLLAAYDGALTSGADFRTFFEWFREREDLENEALRDSTRLLSGSDSSPYPDPQLDTVRKALTQFMPEFSNLTVRRKPLRMEVTKNGQLLTVNQLSDGEKCLMALVGDLARRMAIANFTLENPLAGEGIVLIDEIDLHLHPKWQRMVVPGLIKVFPKCQFLVSTHSPHVLTHVHPENVRLLHMKNGNLLSLDATESYGKTTERILEDLMGLPTTRPDNIADELKLIFNMIEARRLNDARDAVEKLRALIGEDPDLVKASVLIKRMELIGK